MYYCGSSSPSTLVMRFLLPYHFGAGGRDCLPWVCFSSRRERMVASFPSLARGWWSIGSHCPEMPGKLALSFLLVFLELCALQELGVMRQSCNPPHGILLNWEFISLCPLLKWEYYGVCCGILGTLLCNIG